MNIFRSELGSAYSTYSFGYTQYAQRHEGDLLHTVLSAGYLPYSDTTPMPIDCYYLCRSLRIDLKEWSLSSENRRVFRQFENEPLISEVISKKHFNFDLGVKQFCLDYGRTRFSKPLTSERLDIIYKHLHLSHFIKYTYKDKLIALVFLAKDEVAWHYWFAFLSLDHFQDFPLGKFIMTDCIKQAQATEARYMYLGTCYGNHSLYKVRDFKSIEFFDGNQWRSDKSKLKSLCKQDESLDRSDRIKIEPTFYDYLDNKKG